MALRAKEEEKEGGESVRSYVLMVFRVDGREEAERAVSHPDLFSWPSRIIKWTALFDRSSCKIMNSTMSKVSYCRCQ